MLRTSRFFVPASLLVGLVALAACVGDETTVGPTDGTGGADGAAGADGAPGADGSAITDGAGPGTDAAGSDGGPDAAPPLCGFPGEGCCAAPSVPCNAGLSCSIGTKKCLVNDAWAVGEYTVLLTTGGFVNRAITGHYDGVSWTLGPMLPTDWRPTAIHQASATDLRIVSTHNNDAGGKIFRRFSETEFRECTISSGCPTPLLSGGKLVDFYAVTNVDNEYWLGGVNQIYRCASGANNCASTINGLTGTWASGNFAGTTATDLWYSALDRAFHFDGTTWTVHPNLQAYSIYQVRKNDTWVGTKSLQHWNGTAWSTPFTVDGTLTPGSIYAIGGAASDDLWAVGTESNDPSFAAHWNGATWSKATLPSVAKNIQSLWAPSKAEAFVVGQERGTTPADDKAGIYHWNGLAWSQVPSPQAVLQPGETTLLSSLRWVAVHGLARPRP